MYDIHRVVALGNVYTVELWVNMYLHVHNLKDLSCSAWHEHYTVYIVGQDSMCIYKAHKNTVSLMIMYVLLWAHRMTLPFTTHCTIDLNLPATRGRHSTVKVVPAWGGRVRVEGVKWRQSWSCQRYMIVCTRYIFFKTKWIVLGTIGNCVLIALSTF